MKEPLVCEDVEGIASFGVDDRQPMNLVLDQHLHGIIEAVVGGAAE